MSKNKWDKYLNQLKTEITELSTAASTASAIEEYCEDLFFDTIIFNF